MRVGTGYDVHALVPHRPLILGGVHVPHDLGLLGHSDADVLTHAIMDALLGALCLGSIGEHFPDTDPAYKNADSLKLFKAVYTLIQSKGYVIGNIDAVIMAQEPKLSPHIPAMRKTLADTIGISMDDIGIKATTTEKLGFVGTQQGMASQAVVLLKKIEEKR